MNTTAASLPGHGGELGNGSSLMSEEGNIVLQSDGVSPQMAKPESDTEMSEVKEQVLKEVEEMKMNESNLEQIDMPMVNTVDIETLLSAPKDPLTDTDKPDEATEECDMNPQISFDDTRVALEEMKQMDVLVCGICHSVFHFIDDFTRHKLVCRKKSNFRGNVNDCKAQLWAFLLWKNARAKKFTGGLTIESSWKLYQKWCKMPDSARSVWVKAGETVMSINLMTIAKPTDILKPATVKKAIDKIEISGDDAKKPVIMKKIVQRDQGGEIMSMRPSQGKMNEDIENIRNQLEDPSYQNKMKAGEQEEEFVVERIVSRRFNPRRKQYEYLLKWEGYPPEQNTWEPAENLETCQHLLKAFEESLSKQAMNKSSKPGILAGKKPEPNQVATPISPYGRPVRYSKQKALNQVKAWCGSIKPDEAELENLKKRGSLDDSDDDEDYGKRMKMESDSDDTSGPRVVYSRSGGMSGIIKRPGRGRGPGRPPRLLQNGNPSDNVAMTLGLESSGDEGEAKQTLSLLSPSVTKSTLSAASQQVLVANAKGVLRVDNSQVPNLSSGVYIMSNKSGIVKLDSVSPSKALSMKLGKESIPVSTIKTSTSPTTAGSNSVVLLNKSQPNSAVQKTGILRKNPIPSPKVPPPVLPGAKTPCTRPQRPTGSIRINPPPTRIVQRNQPMQRTPTPAATRPKLALRPNDPPQVAKDAERSVDDRNGFPNEQIKNSKMDDHQSSTCNSVMKPTGAAESGPVVSCERLRGDNLAADSKTVKVRSKKNVKLQDSGAGKSHEETFKAPKPAAKPKESILTNKTNQVVKDKSVIMKKTLDKPGALGTVLISPKKEVEEVEENDGDMVTIAGDDGMIYKVSKAQLSNSLIVSGDDGQQCVYMASDENGEDGATVLTLNSYGDSVPQLEQVQVLNESSEGSTQFYVKEGEEGQLMNLTIQGEGEEGQSQLVAQLVEAGEPTPGGGPRRVVLLLPDGNLMMTEVDEEQYAALELDK